MKVENGASGSYTLPSGKTVKTYAEVDVVNHLMSVSPGFKNFYEIERDTIGNVHWIKSNKDIESELGFPRGLKGRMYFSKDNTGIKKLIVLEQIPPTLNDEFIVAHEMCHILIINKGFPGISPRLSSGLGNDEKIERINLASSMNTMIHDPLCNSFLKRYGISYGNLYRDYVINFVKNWRNAEEPVPNTYLGHTLVFKYVLSNLHDASIISDNECLEKYNKFFENKFPYIAEEGNFVLDLIKIWGYYTPKKLSYLYQEILDAMKLNMVCKLETLC